VITIAGGSVTEATPSSALDQSTFDRRFAEVRERVHRICIGLVGRDSVEDVVHDVYLRARSRQAQLRNPEQFDDWICRAAINLCFNRQRAQTRLLDRLPTFAARQQDQPEPGLGLRELIERLPLRERTMVVLHYGYGYRLEEIGELLELTAVNARTILFRARQRLGLQLREAER